MNLLQKTIFTRLLFSTLFFLPIQAQNTYVDTAFFNTENQFYSGTSDSSLKYMQPGYELNSSYVDDTSPEGVERIILNLPGDWATWGKNIFNERNLPFFVGLSAVTLATIKTDHQTWQPVKKLYDRNNFFRSISETFAFVGDGKFQFGLSAGFAAYGFMFKDNKALKTAEQIAEVIFACGATVQLLKRLTGRERPQAATEQTGKWSFFPNQITFLKRAPRFDAFPSGHLATATATLIVIINNYPGEDWIKYIGYPTLGLVSIGLVAKGMHWWSDFPIALVLGYTFADVVTSNKNSQSKMNKEYIDLIPDLNFVLLNNMSPGINFHWKL